MAAYHTVDRADVHTGTATNAGEGIASQRIGEHRGATVVQKDEVELLRSIPGGHTRPPRRVGVHGFAGCRAGE